MTDNLSNGQSDEDVAHFLKHDDRLFPDDWLAAEEHHKHQTLDQMKRRPVTVSLKLLWCSKKRNCCRIF